MKKFTASLLATAAIMASVPASAVTIPSTTSVTSTSTTYLSTTTFATSNHDFNNVGTASGISCSIQASACPAAASPKPG